MWRVVRFLLAWLLAVALPVQGVSAASMAACGAHHGHVGSSGGASWHRARAANDHSHLHAMGTALPAPAAVADATHAKTTLAKVAAPKCSACASCCASAVVPTEAISFDAVAAADPFPPLIARAPAAYVTEGPDRPPRSFLA